VALSRERYSAIGHTGMAFWNPVGEALLDDWIAALPLDAGSRVLDVGCGRGELLVRLIERHACSGVGVDNSSVVIALGREQLARRLPAAACDLRCVAFDPDDFAPHSLDLACCVGSTHAVGSYTDALETLFELVKPGGLLLLGEGYWRKAPDPGYLAFLQSSREELSSHAGNIELAEDLGLETVRACETPEADWARYEDGYAANIYEYLTDHPDDPDAVTMRQRIDAWRNAYLRWGRDTLGFGLYLFRTPA
jgi:SAM-dependent methyltransferase